MVKVKSAKGKSKKITWKRIQHADVDEFLVEQRREERLGLGEKADGEIFQIDVDPLGFDDDYAQLAQKKREAEAKTFSRQKDGPPLVILEDLNCFKILKSHSAVKDPVIKRNPVLKGGRKKTVDMKLKDELRYYRQRETRAKKKTCQSSSSDVRDLWTGSGVGPRTSSILEDDWLTPQTKRNILRNRSGWRPTHQRNEVPAVEVPHPGLSYNPSFSTHQALLSVAVKAAKERMKQDAKVARATATPKVEGDGTLPEVKDEPKEEESEDEDDKGSLRKLPRPKTKQQKRKEKERREKEAKIKEMKDKTKEESQVYRLKTLKKEMQRVDARNKAKLDKKVGKMVARQKSGTLTLSKHKYVEVGTQPLLSDELPKGLVAVGVSGTGGTGEMLLDRFKSLQKRNVLEPTIKHKQKRKNKPKIYIRDSDKMEWEKTGMWGGEKLQLPSGRRRPQAAKGPPKKKNRKVKRH